MYVKLCILKMFTRGKAFLIFYLSMHVSMTKQRAQNKFATSLHLYFYVVRRMQAWSFVGPLINTCMQ